LKLKACGLGFSGGGYLRSEEERRKGIGMADCRPAMVTTLARDQVSAGTYVMVDFTAPAWGAHLLMSVIDDDIELPGPLPRYVKGVMMDFTTPAGYINNLYMRKGYHAYPPPPLSLHEE